MRADLHTHTYFSDGMQSPEELAENAKAAGLTILSVTDHDNMDGDAQKRLAAEGQGLVYIPGMEISAYEGTKIHVTGYNLNAESEAYLRFMRDRRAGAYERTEDILKKLAANGIFITMAEVEACRPVKHSPLHTMHVARAVAKKGYYRDEFTVYAECLRQGKFAYSDLHRPTPFEAVEVIHAAGGIASLAHPGRIEMERGELERLLSRLKDSGLDGIEAVYSTHTEEETAYFEALGKRYSLLITGGSDVHKENVGGRRVGFPVFEPSLRLLEALGIAK